MKKPNLQDIEKRVLGQSLQQAMPIERAELNRDERTVTMAVTSDKPIRHWFGDLILNHAPSAIRLGRLQQGASLLLEHNRSEKIGGLSNPRTDGHVLRCDAKFSRRDKAQAELDDLEDGIPRQVSGGFLVHHIVLVEQRDDDYDLYRSDDWEPIEASLVSIPADPSVGIGRELELPPVTRTDKEECAADTETKSDCACEDHASHSECSDECVCAPAASAESDDNEPARALAGQPAQPVITQVRSQMDKEENKDNELIRLGELVDEVEMARDFVLAKKGVEELRQAIIAKRTTNQPPTPKAPVMLNEREQQRFSIANAVKLQLARHEGRKADELGFERDISDEIEKKLPNGVEKRGGIFVPTLYKRSPEEMQRAGLEVKTANLGGNSVFTEYGGFLDMLRNSTRVMQLGATVLPGLQGPLSFVKQATDSVAYWVGENPGSDVNASDLTLGLVTLSPKTMMARSSYSRQLLAQSVLAADSLVQNSLVQAHAIKFDNSAMHADGTANAITGIYFQSGVNVVAMGGNPTYDKIVDAQTAVRVANANIGPTGFLTTEQVRGKAKKTLEFAVNGSSKLWDGDTMDGLPAYASTNLATNLGVGTNEHAFAYGVWSALLVGEWGAMELLTDPFTLAGQAMIRVISFMMADLQLKYGPCFSKGTGLILS